jgi:hypothetical protein
MEGSSRGNLSKIWKKINGAVNKLREQVAERKKITEEDIAEDLTREEAIIYYFDNINKKLDFEIDKKMLEVFYEIYKLNNKRKPLLNK